MDIFSNFSDDFDKDKDSRKYTVYQWKRDNLNYYKENSTPIIIGSTGGFGIKSIVKNARVNGDTLELLLGERVTFPPLDYNLEIDYNKWIPIKDILDINKYTIEPINTIQYKESSKTFEKHKDKCIYISDHVDKNLSFKDLIFNNPTYPIIGKVQEVKENYIVILPYFVSGVFLNGIIDPIYVPYFTMEVIIPLYDNIQEIAPIIYKPFISLQLYTSIKYKNKYINSKNYEIKEDTIFNYVTITDDKIEVVDEKDKDGEFSMNRMTEENDNIKTEKYIIGMPAFDEFLEAKLKDKIGTLDVPFADQYLNIRGKIEKPVQATNDSPNDTDEETPIQNDIDSSSDKDESLPVESDNDNDSSKDTKKELPISKSSVDTQFLQITELEKKKNQLISENKKLSETKEDLEKKNTEQRNKYDDLKSKVKKQSELLEQKKLEKKQIADELKKEKEELESITSLIENAKKELNTYKTDIKQNIQLNANTNKNTPLPSNNSRIVKNVTNDAEVFIRDLELFKKETNTSLLLLNNTSLLDTSTYSLNKEFLPVLNFEFRIYGRESQYPVFILNVVCSVMSLARLDGKYVYEFRVIVKRESQRKKLVNHLDVEITDNSNRRDLSTSDLIPRRGEIEIIEKTSSYTNRFVRDYNLPELKDIESGKSIKIGGIIDFKNNNVYRMLIIDLEKSIINPNFYQLNYIQSMTDGNFVI